MKQKLKKGARRAAAVLAAITLWASLAASALAAPVAVSTAQELVDELNAAASSSTSTTIVYDTGVASITLNNGTVTIASNTTLDLSASGGTLRIEGGTVYVSGTISGGTVVVAGGTLVRNSGSSITASISISGSGTVRKAYTLSLENLDPASTEKITSIVYSGDADADDSGFVTLAANGVIYPEMANKSDFKIIESVTTDAEHVFRLGTNSTGTLSLEYAISYSGMDGATLTSANPDSYTASDAAIQLCNPTRDGYTFDGWTCAQLSVIDPTTTMVIPEGTTGVLTFTAIWTEIPTGAGGSMGGGQSSTGSSSSTSSDDEESDDETEDTTTTTETAVDSSTTTSVRIRQASSSTKVTFTSDVDTVMPTIESVSQQQSFPWGWTALGVGGAAVLVYIIALILRRARERSATKS